MISGDNLVREPETYNDYVVRLFLLAAAVWGVVGMSIGVLAAAQLAWPALNFDVPWLTFSRIRSNHTFGVIFAFGGSALMGTCYYVVQRTGHTRLALGEARALHVLGLAGSRVCWRWRRCRSASRRARNTPSPSGSSIC